MTELNIGVVGILGKWSTDTLADAVEARTGRRIVVDMGRVELDLAAGRLLHGDVDLCTLDGLIVKKISATYSPATLDRLEMLRVAEACGVRVFSPASNMLRLVDRLSCTVTLRNAGIAMPETRVTEDIDLAVGAVADFGERRLQTPLLDQGARHVCHRAIPADEADSSQSDQRLSGRKSGHVYPAPRRSAGPRPGDGVPRRRLPRLLCPCPTGRCLEHDYRERRALRRPPADDAGDRTRTQGPGAVWHGLHHRRCSGDPRTGPSSSKFPRLAVFAAPGKESGSMSPGFMWIMSSGTWRNAHDDDAR